MYHCNLAKAPVFPLLSKVSNLPSIPNTRFPNWSKIRRFFTPKSTLSTTAFENSDSCEPGSALPWLAEDIAENQSNETLKAAPLTAKSKGSSWVEAADRFLARKGDNRGRNGSAEVFEDSEAKIRDRIGDRNSGFRKKQVQWWKDRGNEDSEMSKERFVRPEGKKWSKQENWGRKTWKEATVSSLPKIVGQSVYGVGPALAALTAKRREFYALYVQEGLDLEGNSKKKKDKKAVEKIMRIADDIGLKVVETSKHDLNMIADNRPHQGLVLDATPLEMVNIRELDPPAEGQKASLWLALDEVTDPQNLGAIIRSAHFFGAEGIVMCAKNSAPLSGVVSKASAGSLELIELLSCKNMMQFLSSSVDNGWRVLGGSVAASAVSLSEIKAGMPTILVLGSEGHGLRPLVERSCTQLIKIPGNIPVNVYDASTEVDSSESNQNTSRKDLKPFMAVDSLNVSVATGVLLYHLTGNNLQ